MLKTSEIHAACSVQNNVKDVKDIKNIQQCKNYTCWLIFIYRPQILPKVWPKVSLKPSPKLARSWPEP